MIKKQMKIKASSFCGRIKVIVRGKSHATSPTGVRQDSQISLLKLILKHKVYYAEPQKFILVTRTSQHGQNQFFSKSGMSLFISTIECCNVSSILGCEFSITFNYITFYATVKVLGQTASISLVFVRQPSSETCVSRNTF